MKQLLLKNSFIAIALMFTFFFFVSCEQTFTDSIIEKELKDVNSSLDKNNSTSVCNELFNEILVEDGKLKFTDLNHYKEVLECLESQVETHNDAFETENSAMTPEQMDDYAEQIGFNEWQPLLDFESNFNFLSRRELVATNIQIWLDNPVLDFENDPDLVDGGINPILRTLLNTNGDVVIGGTTYNFFRNPPLNHECFKVGYKSDKAQYNNGQNQFKMILYANSLNPIVWSVQTSVTNYKKKSNGNWALARTRLFIQVGGSVRDTSCNFPQSFGNFKPAKTRSSYSTTYSFWASPVYVKFKKNEVWGFATVTNSQIPGTIVLN